MGDPQIDIEDFELLCSELTTAFSEDYVDPKGLLHQKAKTVFQIAVEVGMTKSDFRNTLKYFIKNQIYPNWLPGQFFKNDTNEKLYPEKWMVEQCQKNPEAKQFMEGFEFVIDRKKITYWRWARSNHLPFKKIYPLAKPKKIEIIPMPTPPMTDEELKEFNTTKELYKMTSLYQDEHSRYAKALDKIHSLENQIIEYQKSEQERGFTIKEFIQLREANKKNIEIINHLQELSHKFKEYIAESIKFKSISEQLDIWKKLMNKETEFKK